MAATSFESNSFSLNQTLPLDPMQPSDIASSCALELWRQSNSTSKIDDDMNTTQQRVLALSNTTPRHVNGDHVLEHFPIDRDMRVALPVVRDTEVTFEVIGEECTEDVLRSTVEHYIGDVTYPITSTSAWDAQLPKLSKSMKMEMATVSVRRYRVTVNSSNEFASLVSRMLNNSDESDDAPTKQTGGEWKSDKRQKRSNSQKGLDRFAESVFLVNGSGEGVYELQSPLSIPEKFTRTLDDTAEDYIHGMRLSIPPSMRHSIATGNTLNALMADLLLMQGSVSMKQLSETIAGIARQVHASFRVYLASLTLWEIVYYALCDRDISSTHRVISQLGSIACAPSLTACDQTLSASDDGGESILSLFKLDASVRVPLTVDHVGIRDVSVLMQAINIVIGSLDEDVKNSDGGMTDSASSIASDLIAMNRELASSPRGLGFPSPITLDDAFFQQWLANAETIGEWLGVNSLDSMASYQLLQALASLEGGAGDDNE